MNEKRTMDIDADFDEFFADPDFQAAFDDAEFRAKLAANFRAMRKSAKLSQTEVAKTMKTTQSAVSDFERGETDPYFSTLQRYARAVGARMRIILDAPHSNVATTNVTTLVSPYTRVNTTFHVSAIQEDLSAGTANRRQTQYFGSVA
ncbi:Antitoxin HigA [Corynebacterium kalinowskii]|uniref:Antitoxin HigA n=1 Tax=Corynebacterium kalinowskii TaxID=2675216 RepID=A0A6B8V786_9CORY|nr:helix-turn-helix transcriptional regulator [Corynebacterium kalinowskii]QGU00992.1 Antitoxin HigA [Corynebacterium kalinowskii]